MEKTLDKLHNKMDRVEKNSSYAELLAEAKEKLKTPADMTLDEYKEYITDNLQKIPRHPSTFKDDETVVISDEGFAAMQKDSDYEAWVLEYVEKNLAVPDYLCFYPGHSGRVGVMYFGEKKEDTHGTMMSKPSHQPNFGLEESFWAMRIQRLKKRLEAEEKFFLKEKQMLDAAESLAKTRAAQADGLDGTERPELPITGVPASFLLSMLGGAKGNSAT